MLINKYNLALLQSINLSIHERSILKIKHDLLSRLLSTDYKKQVITSYRLIHVCQSLIININKFVFLHVMMLLLLTMCGRHGGLMVSALDSRLDGPG